MKPEQLYQILFMLSGLVLAIGGVACVVAATLLEHDGTLKTNYEAKIRTYGAQYWLGLPLVAYGIYMMILALTRKKRKLIPVNLALSVPMTVLALVGSVLHGASYAHFRSMEKGQSFLSDLGYSCRDTEKGDIKQCLCLKQQRFVSPIEVSFSGHCREQKELVTYHGTVFGVGATTCGILLGVLVTSIAFLLHVSHFQPWSGTTSLENRGFSHQEESYRPQTSRLTSQSQNGRPPAHTQANQRERSAQAGDVERSQQSESEILSPQEYTFSGAPTTSDPPPPYESLISSFLLTSRPRTIQNPPSILPRTASQANHHATVRYRGETDTGSESVHSSGRPLMLYSLQEIPGSAAATGNYEDSSEQQSSTASGVGVSGERSVVTNNDPEVERPDRIGSSRELSSAGVRPDATGISRWSSELGGRPDMTPSSRRSSPGSEIPDTAVPSLRSSTGNERPDTAGSSRGSSTGGERPATTEVSGRTSTGDDRSDTAGSSRESSTASDTPDTTSSSRESSAGVERPDATEVSGRTSTGGERPDTAGSSRGSPEGTSEASVYFELPVTSRDNAPNRRAAVRYRGQFNTNSRGFIQSLSEARHSPRQSSAQSSHNVERTAGGDRVGSNLGFEISPPRAEQTQNSNESTASDNCNGGSGDSDGNVNDTHGRSDDGGNVDDYPDGDEGKNRHDQGVFHEMEESSGYDLVSTPPGHENTPHGLPEPRASLQEDVLQDETGASLRPQIPAQTSGNSRQGSGINRRQTGVGRAEVRICHAESVGESLSNSPEVSLDILDI